MFVLCLCVTCFDLFQFLSHFLFHFLRFFCYFCASLCQFLRDTMVVCLDEIIQQFAYPINPSSCITFNVQVVGSQVKSVRTHKLMLCAAVCVFCFCLLCHPRYTLERVTLTQCPHLVLVWWFTYVQVLMYVIDCTSSCTHDVPP